MIKNNYAQIAALGLASVILLAACSAPAAPAAKPGEPAKAPTTPAAGASTTAWKSTADVDPLKVRGNIVTAGSSTVFPLSERMAAIFKDEGYQGNITIDSIGTGAGFERFCKGETDIANASAKISEAQLEACRKNNIEPVEFRVATDALAIVVNPKNTWTTKLSEQQISDIFSAKAKTWKDVDPSFPDKKIVLYSPGTDSGTFDYFVEKFYKKDRKPILDAKPQLSEDDNVLVQGVSGDEGAIGYFGFAYYVQNKSRVNDVAVNGIQPTAENVDAGKYPVARPLFMYSTARIMKSKPQVSAFIGFYLERVNDGLKKVAYFAAPKADVDKSKQLWLDAISK